MSSSSKRKKRLITPVRTNFQNQSNTVKSGRPVEKALGKIHNEVDKAKAIQARYPNYLPELKARRAKVIDDENKKETSYLSHNNAEYDLNYKKLVLDGLRRISNRSGSAHKLIRRQSSNLKDSSNYFEGHPLFLPTPSTVRRLPKEVLSLYRAPDKTIHEWAIDSPRLAVDLMRQGLAIGPPPSLLPSPVSSQAVLFDIKGHRRKDYLKNHQQQRL